MRIKNNKKRLHHTWAIVDEECISQRDLLFKIFEPTHGHEGYNNNYNSDLGKGLNPIPWLVSHLQSYLQRLFSSFCFKLQKLIVFEV